MRNLSLIFKALADENRLRIFYCCSQIEPSVGELGEILGLSQPLISKHLKILTQACILTRRSEGKSAFYSIEDEFYSSTLFKILLDQIESIESSVLKKDSLKLELLKLERDEKLVSNA